ncbi:MAG: BON domain-containing protein [Candidatus Thiodiazotropha taylori]|nr:BON domain-containing protein [Candidatus Thiodiazotropha taylori]
MQIRVDSPSHRLMVFALLVMLSAHTYGMSDNELMSWIESKSAGSPLLMADNKVRVDINDGRVTLSGQVRLLAQSLEYERIAGNTLGVKAVANRIRVVPESPLSDSEIEHQVRYVMFDTYRRFWHHEMSALITVDDGQVSIVADLRHPRDLETLKYRLAKIEGVTKVAINAEAATGYF